MKREIPIGGCPWNSQQTMDKILSQFIKDPHSSTSIKEPSNSTSKRQKLQPKEELNEKIQHLQLSYSNNLRECSRLQHEIETLFKLYEIATAKLNVTGKEIAHLTMEMVSQQQPTFPHSTSPSDRLIMNEGTSELELLNTNDDLLLDDAEFDINDKNNTIFLHENSSKTNCTKKVVSSTNTAKSHGNSHASMDSKSFLHWRPDYGFSSTSAFPNIKSMGDISSINNENSNNPTECFVPRYNPSSDSNSFEHNSNISKKNGNYFPSDLSKIDSINITHPSSVARKKLILKGIQPVKAFRRKCRFICLNNSALLDNLMITGSLDGMIQFWSFSKRGILKNVPLCESKQTDIKCMPEDIHWNYANDTVGIVWAGEKPTDSYLRLYSNFTIDNSTVKFNSQQIKCFAHSKQVRCLSSLPPASSQPENCRFLTGGDDKSVICWTFNGDNKLSSNVDVLHSNKHTNSIQCIHYSDEKKMVISGGADCKLVLHSLAGGSQEEYRLRSGDRVSNILVRPNDPNTLLLSLCTKSDQLSLFDMRIKRVVQTFGWQENENLSRYAAPSWNPTGNYVGFGSMKENVVNIWDIRNTQSQKQCTVCKIDPLKTQHEGRILKAKFHTDGRTLLTCSTMDNSVNFIEYNVC